MLLHELIFKHSMIRPHATALIEAGSGGDSVTYGELARRVDEKARELSSLGFKKGQRFGILSKNSIAFAEVFFAVSRAGGVAVPLSCGLNSGRIMKIARHAGISGLYTGKGLGREGISVAKALQVKVLHSGVRENALAAIIYTSGTTGEPLGVCLSHKNLISNAKSVAGYVRLSASDSVCCVLPFYYIYGLSVLLSHIFAGAAVVLDNRFMYPNTVLDSIEKFRVTGFAGVSSHYSILLGKSGLTKRKLPSVRYFMQAGDKMPEGLVKKLLSAFPEKKIYLMYGQTEASPRLTYLDPQLVMKKPGSVGKALAGIRIKVIDEKGRECAIGEEGEIAARGDNVMLGYWKNKKETGKALRNGWLYTGDLGYKDKDGDLFITGRKKRFVKVGGVKTGPVRAAGIAIKHPDIFEASMAEMRGFRDKPKRPVNPEKKR